MLLGNISPASHAGFDPEDGRPGVRVLRYYATVRESFPFISDDPNSLTEVDRVAAMAMSAFVSFGEESLRRLSKI
jgi:hypothetical protein